jgi:hypothetical protein
MSSQGLSPLETSLYPLHASRILEQPEGDNEFLVPFDHLKHRFLDLVSVECSVS